MRRLRLLRLLLNGRGHHAAFELCNLVENFIQTVVVIIVVVTVVIVLVAVILFLVFFVVVALVVVFFFVVVLLVVILAVIVLFVAFDELFLYDFVVIQRKSSLVLIVHKCSSHLCCFETVFIPLRKAV